jgi:hypothetical protein
MSRSKARKDAGRPRTPSRLVYDDWVHGVHVRGYQTDTPEISYIVYVRSWTGSVICTTHYVREWWDHLMAKEKHDAQSSYVQKALAGKAGTSPGAAASDASLAAACPALHEFLTLSVLPSGAARTTSTLLVFVEGGLWKAVLNERDAGLSLWATAESLQGLWDELEARLTAPAVDWRPSRRSAPSQPQGGAVDKRRPKQ